MAYHAAVRSSTSPYIRAGQGNPARVQWHHGCGLFRSEDEHVNKHFLGTSLSMVMFEHCISTSHFISSIVQYICIFSIHFVDGESEAC